MVDPTGLNEQLKNSRKKKPNFYSKSFGVGLLGGIIGGLIFLALKGIWHIDSFPLFVFSGIGVMALYLYFVDQADRNNRQLPFLFLAGLVSNVIVLFLYILVSLYTAGAGIRFDYIFDAYFNNTAAGFMDSTLLFHLVAFFFTSVGIGLSWLYVVISVPRWEQKHGKDEPKGIRRRKR